MPAFGHERPPEGLPSFLEPIRCLGEGGMGAVWSVCDRRVGEIGALKAIRPSLLTDVAIVRRFEREMRTIAQLNHLGIVQVMDVGRLETGAPYLLMEQVDGVPLIDLDIRGRTLGELVRLFDRILAALAYAHARRIVHRDLKPDNVLIITDELGELHPKLMDFGLAMVAARGQLATRLTADGMVVGTPAYMAPEQACDEHHKIGPATDLYAFGCMLYELLSGTSPHTASSPMALLLAHATKPPRPFVPLPTLPSASRLEPLILRLLAKDPVGRFELAADVRQELRLSGLLNASDSFDSEPLGPYGDTLLGMPIPDLQDSAGSSKGSPKVSLNELRRIQLDPKDLQPRTSIQLATPAEALLQVSVLNLRESALVGRASELNRLHRYVEDVREANQGAVVLVSGSRGIGKSRLVRWLVEDGETRGALRYLRVNMSANSSVGLSILQGLTDHLRLRGLSSNHAEIALMRFFRTDDAGDWRVRGLLELTVGTDGQSSRRSSNLGRLDLLLYAAMEQLAEIRPIALWLDETHLAPARQVASFIRGLCARQASHPYPMLVIVVDRAESDAPTDLELEIGKIEEAWLRPGIHLQPLCDREMYELTREGLNLVPALADHVCGLAAGLPLLGIELARHWHAAGFLEATPDGFAYRGDESLLPVPEAVHHVFNAQLELAFGTSVGDGWVPLAQLAAVMGDHFVSDALALGAPLIPSQVTPISADQFIERALQSGLIRSVPSDVENAFCYSNSLMREGILGRIASDRIADLHRAAAHAKQALSKNELDPHLRIEIARHHLLGRTYDLAYESFVSAARDLIPQARYDEALHVLDAAQQALASEQGVSGPWDTRVAVIWELEFEIALARRELNQAQDRAGWLRHVAERLNDGLWMARAWRAQGRLLQRLGRLDEAAAHYQKALDQLDLEGAEDSDSVRLEHARTKLIFCECELARDKNAKIGEAVEEVEQIARELNESRLLSRSLALRGLLALFSDQLDEAKLRLDEALTFAHIAGDLRTEATICDSLADVYLAEGDYEKAERCIEHASHGYEALGDFKIIAECHRRLAEIARHQGRTGEAVAHERWIKLLGR